LWRTGGAFGLIAIPPACGLDADDDFHGVRQSHHLHRALVSDAVIAAVENNGVNFMAENEQTKICPLCAEVIKTAAKVCPHCRHWQRKWSLANPYFAVTLYSVIWMVILGYAVAFFDKAFGPKQEFSMYRNEISVVSSQFSQRTCGSNLFLTVVGTLTNHSNVGWKDVGVEAQFFNKSGTLIDAIPVNADDYRGVTLLPHGEAAFKIEGKASHPATDYVTNKLQVRWAKDVNAWFP
jgi:hypothetical protein